ncbi:hypothetical protein RHGRI_003400 [Rhododendron griersonianum]|uniref:Uncharacterized protein n=1 Tax=Rhododendron griersonianum TaxID=479676 RepID=A0AAV6L5C5_9ERIC|nr:hypothetical protein RHGRI_003400 [Rhododendron griersonianum]
MPGLEELMSTKESFVSNNEALVSKVQEMFITNIELIVKNEELIKLLTHSQTKRMVDESDCAYVSFHYYCHVLADCEG